MPINSSNWLAESALEWIPSASIVDDLVIAKPTNFAIAIPRFAISAARIVFLPVVAISYIFIIGTWLFLSEKLDYVYLQRS